MADAVAALGDTPQRGLDIGEDHARGGGELDVDLVLRRAAAPEQILGTGRRGDLPQLFPAEQKLFAQVLLQRGEVLGRQVRGPVADGLTVTTSPLVSRAGDGNGRDGAVGQAAARRWQATQYRV
jgi:hypothetical protein